MWTWMRHVTRVARVLQRFGISPSENWSPMICYGYTCNAGLQYRDNAYREVR